jgi:hypothetical protein
VRFSDLLRDRLTLAATSLEQTASSLCAPTSIRNGIKWKP